MNYKILNSYWYTPTFPGADPLLHVMANLPNIAVVFVAIESHENKWKCYMGWVPYGDDFDEKRLEQMVAQNGAKVDKAVACAHFPSFDPEGFQT